MNRIKFLDGFRGLAILLVVFFHAFTCWTGNVPYGDKFANCFPFKQGFLGVQLFFLISGFVIIMSLEKTDNFVKFIYKRWIRLFPAMFVATVLIFTTATFLPERLNGIPRLVDVIPGLTFIQANDIKKIFHIDILDLENPFWSLYVEVKFYFVFGALYYFLGAKKAVFSIFGLFIIWLFVQFLQENFQSSLITYLYLLLRNFAIANYGWFSSGAFLYLYYINKSKPNLIFSITSGLISVLMFYENIMNMIFIFFLFVLFVLAMCYEKIGNYFDNKLLVFYGFISYPLYLIHESAMIGLINKISKYTNSIPDILLPIIPVLFLSIISYFIADLIEPFTRKMIDNTLRKSTKRVFASISTIKN